MARRKSIGNYPICHVFYYYYYFGGGGGGRWINQKILSLEFKHDNNQEPCNNRILKYPLLNNKMVQLWTSSCFRFFCHFVSFEILKRKPHGQITKSRYFLGSLYAELADTFSPVNVTSTYLCGILWYCPYSLPPFREVFISSSTPQKETDGQW